MKLWKKKQAAALSLAVLMALPGCQTPDPGTSGSGTSDPSAQQVEAAATDPTHIYEEVGGNFLIDAEISGPPEGVVPKVYRGHYKSFSKEEVDAFLEQVGDSVAEIRSDGIKGKNYHYSGICTNGGRVFLQTNADGTTTTSIFNYDREENALKEYPIYTGQDDYNENKNNRLAFLFEEPVDLACGTAEEAEKAIRAALTALGLSDVVLNRTLYISHDRMVQADELMQSEEWIDIAKGGLQGRDWTEADDCYMFEFFCGVDGMPLSYQNWKRETTTYCGNDIQVWYDANGILSLQVDYPWVADEAIEEPDQVISAEEALLVVQNKIGNVITDQNQELQSLTLRYLYRQDGDAWLLIPVWEAVIHQASKDPDSWVPESCTYVTVDAITGKEIVS